MKYTIFIPISMIVVGLFILVWITIWVSCSYTRTIYRYDTLWTYDTVKIVKISDCINYVLDFTDLDSSDSAELNKVFNEFIRKLNKIQNESNNTIQR